MVAAVVVVLLGGGVWRAMAARQAQQKALAETTAQRAQAPLQLAAQEVLPVRRQNLALGVPVSGALRAVEIGAEVILKATKVDGIYTADPALDPTATKLPWIGYIIDNYELTRKPTAPLPAMYAEEQTVLMEGVEAVVCSLEYSDKHKTWLYSIRLLGMPGDHYVHHVMEKLLTQSIPF